MVSSDQTALPVSHPGSANIQSLPAVKESLVGRIAKIRLRPLAPGEMKKIAPRFIF